MRVPNTRAKPTGERRRFTEITDLTDYTTMQKQM